MLPSSRSKTPHRRTILLTGLGLLLVTSAPSAARGLDPCDPPTSLVVHWGGGPPASTMHVGDVVRIDWALTGQGMPSDRPYRLSLDLRGVEVIEARAFKAKLEDGCKDHREVCQSFVPATSGWHGEDSTESYTWRPESGLDPRVWAKPEFRVGKGSCTCVGEIDLVLTTPTNGRAATDVVSVRATASPNDQVCTGDATAEPLEPA